MRTIPLLNLDFSFYSILHAVLSVDTFTHLRTASYHIGKNLALHLPEIKFLKNTCLIKRLQQRKFL